jgi:hypothetical protein
MRGPPFFFFFFSMIHLKIIYRFIYKKLKLKSETHDNTSFAHIVHLVASPTLLTIILLMHPYYYLFRYKGNFNKQNKTK